MDGMNTFYPLEDTEKEVSGVNFMYISIKEYHADRERKLLERRMKLLERRMKLMERRMDIVDYYLDKVPGRVVYDFKRVSG